VLTLDDIAGQREAVDLLRRLLRSGRVPQALLFRGPEGVGKATTARTFAAALMCDADGTAACGRCASCVLNERETHPDYLRVGRLTRQEIKNKENSRLFTQVAGAAEGDLASRILVDQIRKLTGIVGFRPRQGRRRVALIDPADRMNREAQNGLLKTLEEPPAGSLVILISARPHLLLPTVRSRCFSIGFSTMRVTELSALLERRGMPPDEAAARAALSGGSLGRALELDLEVRRGRRREILEMLDTLSSSPAAIEKLPAMAASLAGKDDATLVDALDLSQSLLRDAARCGVADARGALLHADLYARLDPIAARLGPHRAASLVQCIDRLRADLRFNTNRVLTAEALLAAVAGGPLP